MPRIKIAEIVWEPISDTCAKCKYYNDDISVGVGACKWGDNTDLSLMTLEDGENDIYCDAYQSKEADDE